jgi:hypothetical protein
MTTNTPSAQTERTSVITIHVPSTLKWQPQVAQQLLVSWFALSEPLSLIIRATANSIEWQVETWRKQEAALKQTLYGFYPSVQIKANPKPSPPIGFRLYHFKAHSSFIAPLLTIQEFPQIDPLSGVVSAIGTLQKNEILIYELRLYPTREKYYELGEQLLKALIAQAEADKKTKELPRYGLRQQQLAISKLDAPLKEVEFAVKIKTDTKERSEELIGLLKPALAIYESEGLNQLVPAYKPSLDLVLTASEVAAMWHLPSEQCKNSRIKWARGASAPLPQYAGGNNEQIVLGVNDFQGSSQVASLAYRDRISHVNLLGGTGVGKSTSMHHMIHQDILAGKSIGVIDPHGNLVQNILRSSIPKEREKDVVLLDVRDTEYPIGLNLLKAPANVSREEVASQTVSVIRKIFADYWSPTRMETALYAALTTLMSVEDSTIIDVPRLFHDSDFRSRFYTENTDPMALQYWRYQFEPASWNQRNEIANPIMHRLSKFYANPALRNMVCQTTCLDFAAMLDQNPIFLANLGGMPDVEAETLGALLISKLQIAGMSRGAVDENDIVPFYLYIDEVQNFITTSLPALFSGARKYGLSLVVANQYLHQLEGETLESILGNVGTSIIFQVGPKDAAAVAPYVKPYFSNSDLESMGRFRAVIKTLNNAESMPAFNVQTYAPLLPNDDAEEQVERIKAYSRAKYGRRREDVERELNKRLLASQQAGSEAVGDEEGDSYLG